jgi:hydroxyacylglutathione hydrolase
MFDLQPIPAFRDNYIWSLFNESGDCLIVDPGDADPVSAFLAQKGFILRALLITHHHPDHTGGIAQLVEAHDVPVYGPATEAIPCLTNPLQDEDTLQLFSPPLISRVLAVPGHTAGHIAYYFSDMSPPALFAGDTLFAGGCGRLFEGTPAQMLASLDKFAALPNSTRLCCAHEYTLANLSFAQAVSPENTQVRERIEMVRQLRAAGRPSLPSTLAEEKATNPFLRVDDPGIQEVLESRGAESNRISRFAELRRWKDSFRA